MAVPSDPGPVVQHAILTSELVRLRRERGDTQDQVAAALDWSPSKLIRIEGGTVGVSTTDLQALLRHYGIQDGDSRIQELINIAKEARRKGWWALYRKELDREYQKFIGYEAGASVIRSFNALTVPGLLQTEEYANALTIEFITDPSERDITVEVRLQRQDQILGRQDSPQLFLLIDEAALQRRVGGQVDPRVMPQQLEHIIGMLDEPNISIEIIPFGKGAHFGMKGPFTILEFSDIRIGEMLFLESADRAENTAVADRDFRIPEYRAAFENLRQIALPAEESIAFIREIIDSMD
jgi:transcriptional regulator with XRE-family HTH domain